MHHGYTVMCAKKSSRINGIVFAVLALIIIGTAQFFYARGGGALAPDFYLAYAPGIAIILAVCLRSYLVYLLAIGFYTAHQIIGILLLSFKAGAYTSFELFETATEYILFALAGCLLWQAILFWLGHADIVALTHTTMIFVVFSLLLTFLPYIIRVFHLNLYITDSYNVVCLGFSFLAFAHGIEKAPDAE